MEKKINWKYDIGEIVKNKYRDITIIDKEIRVKEFNDNYNRHHIYNKKYYKYKCNICGHIDWIHESTFRDEKRDFHICKKFDNFYYNIGENIVDEKRDITILQREYRHDKKDRYIKWCRYRCNKCGWNDGWSKESNIKKGNGCACCSGKVVVKGINDIATTNPEVIKYLIDKDDAYLYTRGDRVSLKCKCTDCGYIDYKYLPDLVRYGFVCHRCSDGISYPEKFIFSVLDQLGVKFKTQLSKKTFKWIGKYYYDIYFKLNNEEYIVEIHGIQHYKNKYNFYGETKTYINQQKIDNEKFLLAINNGIKKENYIILDARYSKMDYMINSIINSKLSKLFDLNNVDFTICNQYAVSSKMVDVCKYYESHPDIKLIELAEIFKCSRPTIRGYLYSGNDCGIINYDWEKHKKENTIKTGHNNGKKVAIYDLKNNLLGEFMSCSDLERKSLELFKIELKAQQIRRACRGELKGYYKGFIFKYI